MFGGINSSNGRQSNSFLLDMSADSNSHSTTSSQLGNSVRGGDSPYLKTSSSINCSGGQRMRKLSPMALSRRTSSARRRSVDRTLLAFRNVESTKSHIKDNLRKYSTILFLLSVVASLAAIIDMEVSIERRQMLDNVDFRENISSTEQYDNMRYNVYSGVELSTKTLISILSMATCICLYCFYLNLYHLDVVRHLYPEEGSFCVSTIIYRFIGELLICCTHVPPWMDRFNVPPELQLVVFLRLYLVTRFLKEKHQLMTSKSTRFLASVTKTELSSIFLLKTYFLRNPFALIIGCYLMTISLGGYAVYLVEGTSSYLDTTWMVVVTMTTVGFGDFSPKTVIGRVMVATAALIGIFLMALFISLVNDSMQLSQQEKRILAYIDGTEHTRYRKTVAATVIQTWWRYGHFKRTLFEKAYHKRNVYDKFQIRLLRNKMYRVLMNWRVIRCPSEHHLNKDFQVDNTAILLTNVARKVVHIEASIASLAESVKPLRLAKTNAESTIQSQAANNSKRKASRVAWHQTVGNQGREEIGHIATLQQQQQQQHLMKSHRRPHTQIQIAAEYLMDSNGNTILESKCKVGPGQLKALTREMVNGAPVSSHLSNDSPSEDQTDDKAINVGLFEAAYFQLDRIEAAAEKSYNGTKKELYDLKVMLSAILHNNEDVAVPKIDIEECAKITSMKSSVC